MSTLGSQDQMAIARLVNAYADGSDAKNWPQIRECFVATAQFEDYKGGKLCGEDVIVAAFRPMLEPFPTTQHLIGVPYMRSYDGDTAVGVLYCIGTHVLPGALGGEVCSVGVRYDDAYINTATGGRSADARSRLCG
ncbi:MAG: nuclear transport factor 2 family protein [Steroidobacteraceae bacterium]